MEEIAEAGNEDAEHFGIIKPFDEKNNFYENKKMKWGCKKCRTC